MLRHWCHKMICQLGLYPYTAERRDVLGCTSPTTQGQSSMDILSAKRNLELGRDVQLKSSRLEAVFCHSLIINSPLGKYQEIQS